MHAFDCCTLHINARTVAQTFILSIFVIDCCVYLHDYNYQIHAHNMIHSYLKFK